MRRRHPFSGCLLALVLGALLWIALISTTVKLAGQSTYERLEADCWASPVCQQASHAVMHAGLSFGLDKLGGSWIEETEAAWIGTAVAVLMEVQDVAEHGLDGGDHFGRWDPLVDLTVRVGGSWSVHLLP